jgi:hypothetical protein
VRLLGLDQAALLSGVESGPLIPRDGTLLGQLFESLVTLSIKTFAQASEARVAHLRLKGGRREIDLIVERPDLMPSLSIRVIVHIEGKMESLLYLRLYLGRNDVVDKSQGDVITG